MGSKIRSLNKFNKVVDKLPVFLYSFKCSKETCYGFKSLCIAFYEY